MNYICKEFNGTYTKSIKELIEKFPRMCQFCNGNLNKFVLLLRVKLESTQSGTKWCETLRSVSIWIGWKN